MVEVTFAEVMASSNQNTDQKTFESRLDLVKQQHAQRHEIARRTISGHLLVVPHNCSACGKKLGPTALFNDPRLPLNHRHGLCDMSCLNAYVSRQRAQGR